MNIYQAYRLQKEGQTDNSFPDTSNSAIDNYILARVENNRIILDGNAYDALVDTAAGAIAEKVLENVRAALPLS